MCVCILQGVNCDLTCSQMMSAHDSGSVVGIELGPVHKGLIESSSTTQPVFQVVHLSLLGATGWWVAAALGPQQSQLLHRRSEGAPVRLALLPGDTVQACSQNHSASLYFKFMNMSQARYHAACAQGVS